MDDKLPTKTVKFVPQKFVHIWYQRNAEHHCLLLATTTSRN